MARHVGPIARLLVSKAAAAATNEAELYERLAHAVPDATERADFLREALINAAMGSFAAKANVFLVKAASHSGGRERMA